MATVTWADTGADETLTLAGVVTVAARVGTQGDILGGTPTPRICIWRLLTKLATAGIAGQSIQIYAAFAPNGSASDIDGEVGTSDADITDLNNLNNLKHIGSVIVDDIADGSVLRGSGRFICWDRYLSPIILNATAETMHATDANHAFEIEDVADA